MFVRALMIVLPVALGAAAQDQTASQSSTSSPTTTAKLGDAIRPLEDISPAAGSTGSAPAPASAGASDTLQPPDGYIENPDTAMQDLETWFRRFSKTQRASE